MQPDALVGLRPRPQALGGRVARGVVDDDDLDVQCLARLRERAVEARVDLLAMVVGGDQDRDEGGRSHSATIRRRRPRRLTTSGTRGHEQQGSQVDEDVQEDRREQALGVQGKRCEHAAEHRGEEHAPRALVDVGQAEHHA